VSLPMMKIPNWAFLRTHSQGPSRAFAFAWLESCCGFSFLGCLRRDEILLLNSSCGGAVFHCLMFVCGHVFVL
jgi:hypothetical protein